METLGISISKVYSVATFYENFSLEAKGKHIVKVCTGTACIAGGSLKIYDALKAECEKRGLKTRVALRHEGGDDAIHFKKSGCSMSLTA